MAISQNYPSITPSLNLDFAKSKFLDPRITFTRASVGTLVDANGLIRSASSGAARFDHNPITGESLGLLIEQSVTNGITYSEQMNDASWSKSTVTITTNAAVAPDGNTTADRLVITSTSPTLDARYCFTKGNGIGGGNPATLSVFVKKDTARYFNMGFHNYGGLTAYVNFDLDLGTYALSGVHPSYGSTSASIVPFPNNWYRVSFSVASDQGGNISFFASSNSAIVPTDGTSGVFLWGAQCEQLTFPTSYIPTTAASVTRAADVATMTGTNFSSWYNTPVGGGTIFASYRAPNSVGVSLVGNIWSFDGGGIRWLANWGPFQVYDGSVAMGISPSTLTSPVKDIAALERVGNVTSESIARNGILGSNSANIAIAGMNQLSLGLTTNTGLYLNGTISQICYWKSKLTDSQLQSLTR